MADQSIIQDKLGKLKDMCSAGYALAMHVHFTAPTFLFQTYDRAWLEHYSQKGLVMSDPTVHWGFENRGFVDWSSLIGTDPDHVLQQAADFGLNHGITCSVGPESRPSIGSFARSDRTYTPAEAEALCQELSDLHSLTDNLQELSPETADALRKMSIKYTHPE